MARATSRGRATALVSPAPSHGAGALSNKTGRSPAASSVARGRGGSRKATPRSAASRGSPRAAAPESGDSDNDDDEEEEENTSDSEAEGAGGRATKGGAGLATALDGATAASGSSGAAGGAGSAATDVSVVSGDVLPVNKRWRDWCVRWVLSLIMISAVLSYVYMTRQWGVALMVFGIQAAIYNEVVRIAINDSREQSMPVFRVFYYYWFLVSAYYLFAWTLQEPLMDVLAAPATVALASPGSPVATLLNGARFAVEFYVPISFALYTVSFVGFVLSLRHRRNFRYQFSQLGYCVVAILMISGQSTTLVTNTFSYGLLWFFLAVTLVVVNDSFAYIFGFFFGRTPLIRLSPKKTWEGFIGGAAATLAAALIATHFMQSSQWLACPYAEPTCDVTTVHGGIYVPKPLSVHFPAITQWLIPPVWSALPLSRLQLHALVMAVFASAVAPFGGFFASGFKRAFKIKDFSQAIPGHGGFTDRMDCQIVMGCFVYIYARWVMGLRGPVAPAALLANLLDTLTGSGVAPTPNLPAVLSGLRCYLSQPSIAAFTEAARGGSIPAAAHEAAVAACNLL